MEELIKEMCDADRRNEEFAKLISAHALNERLKEQEGGKNHV